MLNQAGDWLHTLVLMSGGFPCCHLANVSCLPYQMVLILSMFQLSVNQH